MNTTKDIPKLVEEAYNKIKNNVLKTPLVFSQDLSSELGSQIYLKCENQQRTGSFKLRGAHNKISRMGTETSFITSSSGNHGLGCIDAMNTYGVKGKIVVLRSIAKVKEEKLVKAGASLIYYDGDDCEQCEEHAKLLASKSDDLEYVSPYNDWNILAGQGTVGLEILAELPDVDVVFVSVGGRGLMAGIAGYIKDTRPNVRIVGCQPSASPVMFESVKAGKIIDYDSEPTLSEGTAGGIEKGSITFEICRDLVDEWVVVEEKEIRSGMDTLAGLGQRVEGAAGLALAAATKISDKIRDKKVCILLCGGNVSK